MNILILLKDTANSISRSGLGAVKEKIMSEEMENVEEVSVEEALQMEIIFGQALMDVLVTKGLISEEEVLDRVEEIRRETGFELS